jgi:DNA repair protein RadC
MKKTNKKTVKRVSIKLVREQTVTYSKESITNKNDIDSIASIFLENSAIERFIVIGLNTANCPNVVHCFEGTVDQCAAYPQTIFKVLLLSNCNSYIIAHNHPCNTMSASSADKNFTEHIKNGGKLLDLQLLDHVIYNSDLSSKFSFREYGIL